MRIALCACAKNEQLYLKDWIQYHLDIGVNHIYLIDNNNPLDERQHEVACMFPSVTWIDARGELLAQMGFQSGAYQRCYELYGNLYDWIGFIDIDEFIDIENVKDVNTYFSQSFISKYSIIHINWKCYGDNDLIKYDSRPVYERFAIPCEDTVKYANKFCENNHVKSFIRGNLPSAQIGIHTSIVSGICGRANGMPGNMNSSFEPYNFEGAFIKHYITKSLLEYIDRRCVDTSIATSTTLIDANKRLEWFFNINHHTPLKDKIVGLFKQTMEL